MCECNRHFMYQVSDAHCHRFYLLEHSLSLLSGERKSEEVRNEQLAHIPRTVHAETAGRVNRGPRLRQKVGRFVPFTCEFALILSPYDDLVFLGSSQL